MKRLNELKLENGKIVIFQRNDVKGDIWYANFSLGHGKRAMRSLDTSDRAVAEHKAKDIYRQLLVKVDQNLPIKPLKFSEFWDRKWLPYAKKRLSKYRYDLHEGVNRRRNGTPYRRPKGTPLGGAGGCPGSP